MKVVNRVCDPFTLQRNTIILDKQHFAIKKIIRV